MRDVARAVRLATESSDSVGEVFNLAEPTTSTMRQLAEEIIAATGSELELVQVPDDSLPPDLRMTGAVQQHFVIDASKAQRILGWQCGDSKESLQATVLWHRAHPPIQTDDFSADKAALNRELR